ncbi:hypothetical protein GOBAR_AA12874 [Gossypium barbadense]|uniref:HP domain-containing protein n=1 Tax=Gossypium barbadense TaxID=3634 RepID=A0A2P5XWP7_GOSBA|nr:hypothetical protein GOBAR_AA12874 [Gossypium barbadense]
MGCSTSKLDDEEAVQLCKDRKNFIKQAVEQRTRFATGHLAYIQSLKRVSAALQDYVEGDECHEFLLDSFITPPFTPVKKGSPGFISIQSNPKSTLKVSYLRSGGNPAVAVEERPQSPETVRVQAYSPVHHYGMDGIFAMQSSPMNNSSFFTYSPNNRPNIPPPSPQSSQWDFFWNPFSSLDYYGYPNRSSLDQAVMDDDVRGLRQVREEEGIPDLEEDETEHEESENKPQRKVSVEVVRSQTAGEVEVSNKETAVGSSEAKEETPGFTVYVNRRPTSMAEVINDLDAQFMVACDAASEVSGMLEASRAQYSSTSNELTGRTSYMANNRHENVESGSFVAVCFITVVLVEILNEFFEFPRGSHQSTLDRLYAWEKKLYEEVKSGEKTRIAYEKKSRQLRNQDVKGDDPSVVDKTRAAIRDLHTQMKVSIHSVEAISKRIETLRDEELQPQLLELVHGLARMWKVMAECHQAQKRTLDEAKLLLAGAPSKLEAKRQSSISAAANLEAELRNWRACFESWIVSQRSYLRALSGWLLRCLRPDPDTSKLPFSPRRSSGTLVIFGLCIQWSRFLDATRETPVLDGIDFFAAGMGSLYSQQLREESRVGSKRFAPGENMELVNIDEVGDVMTTEKFSDVAVRVLCAGMSVAMSSLSEFAISSADGYAELISKLPQTSNGSGILTLEGQKHYIESFIMSLAVSMRNLDQAFQGAGQKAYPFTSETTFHTFASKSGVLRHDIHYWLGKDTSQDEAGAAAVKTIELDAALGGRAVQYREVQDQETNKFLSLFKPCIMPQEGGVATGFKQVDEDEYKTRLLVCKGKQYVQVPFARSTLNHENIFILDTQSKIFQFNGSNTSIQERAKALEAVQYIRDTYHDGKCDIATIEDGKLMADADSGEFWALFGGFAPLPRKTAARDEDTTTGSHPTKKLLSVEKGKADPIEVDSLTRELLDTDKCYILDCGLEVYVWMGRNTSLDERKSASRVAEELLRDSDRPKSHLIRVIEGFETITFRSKFESWPQTTNATVTEEGRGKVAALLQRQGLNVKGLLKAAPEKEEPQAHIDCTGNLQVWRVNGQNKVLLSAADQSKFYSGDCYIFQYSYTEEDKEEHLIGTWFGKQSVEEERASAVSLASKMVESMKVVLVMDTGSTFAEKEIPDETYTEDGVALFRVQGSGPENMQAIQVEAVTPSLNSSYCYILHSGSNVFTWAGGLTSPDDQDLVERQLDLIKPDLQTKPQKEGSESDEFWELLGGKTDYPSQKISSVPEGDPHLFSCTYSKGTLKVMEIYNFTQDDLMTEDIFILDCHSDIFVWVGQLVDTKSKLQALTIGEKFLKQDFLFENLSCETPIYIVMEGSEPPFFTRFFTWDSAKSNMQGNSFQRKLTIMKHGGTPITDKPKRRGIASIGGRSSGAPEKPQRSRSVSFSPDRPRVRGRSPAFNALASRFENPSSRNLSTPPPMVRKVYPKSGTPDSGTKAAAIAALTESFDRPSARETLMPRIVKKAASPAATKTTSPEPNTKENSMSSRLESLTIQEDMKEGETEDEEGLPIHPYERLTTSSTDPVTDIDVTKRETYLSATEFKEKFGMKRVEFYKLPKWKQNKLKMGLQLF